MAVEQLHEGMVKGRRVRVLTTHFHELLPAETTSLLDVGTGDGRLVANLRAKRGNLQLEGLETHLRPDAVIPVREFDGTRLPLDDQSVDAVSFIDVLHHTANPRALLVEAARVARHTIVVKDHVVAGLAARGTLRFMDRVGNARFGVALPYNYQSWPQWDAHVEATGWRIAEWRTKLGLYPFFANWWFGRELHCFFRLEPRS